MSDQKSLVLVVEDNDFVRMQITSFLKGASYETVEASGGEGALALMASSDNIALAIVDVNMAPIGGFEFIKSLRSRDIKTPIILVTGDQAADLLELAGKLGVAAVLMKPVERDRLIKTVDRTMDSIRRAK